MMSKQQDIPQSDNELIAAFMGYRKINNPDLPDGADGTTRWTRSDDDYDDHLFSDEFEYDASWDWLMPVVEKINAIEIIAEPRGENLQEAVRKYVGMVQIKDAHMYVVNFIQWYNLNQQTPKP